MKRLLDPLLMLLVFCLLATLTAFFLGVTVYPFGLLVLLIAVVARLLYLQLRDSGSG